MNVAINGVVQVYNMEPRKLVCASSARILPQSVGSFVRKKLLLYHADYFDQLDCCDLDKEWDLDTCG